MEKPLVAGVALTLLAGVMSGNCMLPLKFVPLIMGFLWMGAFALYSLASSFLGPLGTSIGWGLMQIFMIAAATTSGIFSGEWKGAARSAVFFLSSGLAALGFAIVLLAKGSR